MTEDFKTKTDNRISNIEHADRLVFAFVGGLVAWAVPIASASIFGFIFHASTNAYFGPFSYFVGVCAGLGVIAAGYYASHSAVKYQSTLAWGLVLLYISLEIGSLWAMFFFSDEVENELLPIAGTTMALIVLIVYIVKAINLAGMWTENREVVLEEQKVEERAEDKKANRELRFELRLAEIEAQKEVEIVKAQTQALPQFSEPEATLPQWLPRKPKDKDDFLKLVFDGEMTVDGLKPKDLYEAGIVGTERTALNWLTAARNGHKE